MFTVDSEFEIGARRISNDEVAEAAAANADMMMAFASIDPHKGKMGVREARDLVEAGVIKGFKFIRPFRASSPTIGWPTPHEVIAEHKLPAIFHSGHSGIGTGMPGGGGLRLKYSNPIHVDDVAVDFPDMTIIIAHSSWPWQDEALSVCLHKPNVYIDLSGWSPKYFPSYSFSTPMATSRPRCCSGRTFRSSSPTGGSRTSARPGSSPRCMTSS